MVIFTEMEPSSEDKHSRIDLRESEDKRSRVDLREKEKRARSMNARESQIAEQNKTLDSNYKEVLNIDVTMLRSGVRARRLLCILPSGGMITWERDRESVMSTLSSCLT